MPSLMSCWPACIPAVKGVTSEEIEALAWISLSAVSGDKDFIQFRDSLAKVMSPEQVDAARKRAEELRAMIESKTKNAK